MNTLSIKVIGNQVKDLMRKKDKVRWKGTYIEDGLRKTIVFNYLRVNPDGVIYGRGKDRVGLFYVKGSVVGNKELHFTMYYRKEKLNPAFAKATYKNGVLTGTITLEEFTMDFEVKMKNYKVFKGSYERTDVDGAEIHSSLEVLLSKGGFFGLGHDESGFYVIDGKKYPKKYGRPKKLKITKSYFGGMSISHKGNFIKKKNLNLELVGEWVNDQAADIEGVFSLTYINPKNIAEDSEQGVESAELAHFNLIDEASFFKIKDLEIADQKPVSVQLDDEKAAPVEPAKAQLVEKDSKPVTSSPKLIAAKDKGDKSDVDFDQNSYVYSIDNQPGEKQEEIKDLFKKRERLSLGNTRRGKRSLSRNNSKKPMKGK